MVRIKLNKLEYGGWGSLYSEVWDGSSLYGEVQYTMGNCYMGNTPSLHGHRMSD